MARSGYVPLYKKQKKYITEIHDSRGITSADEMSVYEWDILKSMHDTETLWSDANRFLSDLHFERQRKYS